jgi:AraC family transcriptional regulator, arabinose operon regulatory protein
MRTRDETPSPLVAPLVTGHFKEGKGYATWRTHGTNDYLLMLTLDGKGRVGWQGGEREVAAGDVVLLRPGTLHDYGVGRRAANWELLWAHFLPRPHWLEWLGWPEVAPGLGILSLGEEGEARERIEEALREMNRRARGGQPRREAFALNALEAALLWCDAANPKSAQGRLDARVVRAMEYLRERLHEPVPMPELAQAVGLSSSRLTHLFREQVGQTPQRFVEAERIARAKQLLSLTSRTVAAIAEEVGFENPFYFTLRFKKYTGQSPREWRRRVATQFDTSSVE